MVDRLEQEYEGKVLFKRLNPEEDAEASSIMAKYNLTSIPTFMFVNRDGSVAETLIGAAEESRLRQSLDALK